MTHPENGKPLWDESRVEALLEQFFQREIPAPLRGQNPARLRQMPASTASQTPAAKARANSAAGGVMVGFSLLLMLMVAMTVWDGSPNSPNTRNSSTGDDSTNASHSQRDDGEAGPLEPLKHDDQGPIELRPRTRPVGTEGSGTEKSLFPELDVEVFPLDVDSPSNQDKSRKPSAQETPMPEEGRTLPESQPPAADPDEAQIEPMLPELRAIFPTAGID